MARWSVPGSGPDPLGEWAGPLTPPSELMITLPQTCEQALLERFPACRGHGPCGRCARRRPKTSRAMCRPFSSGMRRMNRTTSNNSRHARHPVSTTGDAADRAVTVGNAGGAVVWMKRWGWNLRRCWRASDPTCRTFWTMNRYMSIFEKELRTIPAAVASGRNRRERLREPGGRSCRARWIGTSRTLHWHPIEPSCEDRSCR